MLFCAFFFFILTIPASCLTVAKRSAIPVSSLYGDFQTYIRFAYAAGCNETLFDQVFPLGSDWDQKYPTRLIKSAYAPNTTGAGYLAINDKLQAIIIGFRGTATKKLWLEDFQFWGAQVAITQVPPDFLSTKELINANAKSALIHYGFQKTYLDHLRDIIQPALNEVARAYPSHKVVFTGHSLGAALTELAAVDFFKNSGINSDRIYLYGYASPRVGNEEWATFVDGLPFARKSYRLVKYGDAIPHLPPEFLRYHHSFQQYSILPNNEIISCNQYSKNSHDCIYDDSWEMKDYLKKNIHSADSYLSYFNQSFTCHYD